MWLSLANDLGAEVICVPSTLKYPNAICKPWRSFALLGCCEWNIRGRCFTSLYHCAQHRCLPAVWARNLPTNFNAVASASSSLHSLLHLNFILCEKDKEAKWCFPFSGSFPLHLFDVCFPSIFYWVPTVFLSGTLSEVWVISESQTYCTIWQMPKIICCFFGHDDLAEGGQKMGCVGEQQKRVGSTKDKWNLLRQYTFTGQKKKNKCSLLQRVQSPSKPTLSHLILSHAGFCSPHSGCLHTFLQLPVYSTSFIARDSPERYTSYCLVNRRWQSWGKR